MQKAQQNVSELNSILKRLYTMTKWDLFQECKSGSTSANQSMWYTTLIEQRKNCIVISVDSEKAFDKNLTLFNAEKHSKN